MFESTGRNGKNVGTMLEPMELGGLYVICDYVQRIFLMSC